MLLIVVMVASFMLMAPITGMVWNYDRSEWRLKVWEVKQPLPELSCIALRTYSLGNVKVLFFLVLPTRPATYKSRYVLNVLRSSIMKQPKNSFYGVIMSKHQVIILMNRIWVKPVLQPVIPSTEPMNGMVTHDRLMMKASSGIVQFIKTVTVLPISSMIVMLMMGPWEDMGDPCIDDIDGTTYNSQSTFVFSLEGKEEQFILMAERHNIENFLHCSIFGFRLISQMRIHIV